ncbi:MAG: aconitate hydratase [Myxococcota bacterium]
MSGLSMTRRLIEEHVVRGKLQPGETVTLRPDQVLLQDTNGPMSFLQFEALGAPSLQVSRVVSYVDHNTVQVDSRNSDDHRYLETASARYGAIISRAGNGICHQVHLESFSVPTQMLVGTDSHSVLCGAVGMLAFGAGSIEVALAMGTGRYSLTMPRIVQVRLEGQLRPWVTAKDAVLELLRRFSVNGGREQVFEFTGPGVSTLTVPQRATIANMGAELGLTTALFPSDEMTKAFFGQVGRIDEWRPLEADKDAHYDDSFELDLSSVDVLVAEPGSPDRVVPVGALAGTKLEQVIVGSCTNGSWEDMAMIAAILGGQQVHPSISGVVFPGSRRVMEAMAREGLVAELIAAGLQIAGSSCGACPGLSHVPATGTKSLRTFNRNFPGRSGNRDDHVYLCSPAVAAASMLTGEITDPRTLGDAPPPTSAPASLRESPGGVRAPETSEQRVRLQVIRGPNIKEVPLGHPPASRLDGPVLLKLGDNISTDHISPVGVQSLLLRTNIPAISEHSFKYVDPTFATRARASGGGVIVAGVHYGQGSSRETAASGLMVLGIRAIIAKSFARIHRANLINWGIVPLEFDADEGYEQIDAGDELHLEDLRGRLERGDPIPITNQRTGARIEAHCTLAPRERELVIAGGVLAHARARGTARA